LKPRAWARPARDGPQGGRHQGRDTIVEGAGKDEDIKVDQPYQTDDENTDSAYDREKLQERCQLSGAWP